MEPYKYQAVKHGYSIRMLTVFPGKPDEDLAGSLDDFDMKSTTWEPYEPLSYVWGKPKLNYAFHIDGKVLKITKSLNDALRRLRLRHEPRRLWADQICIDQTNLSERGEQVQFMNAIYKRAKHVLVWLGSDDSNEAEAAFAKVKSLADIFAGDKYYQFRTDHAGANLAQRSEDDWLPINSLTRLPWVKLPCLL